MSEPQRRHRRQRVKNIAHCTQADNEQAEVGLRVQSLIFAQPEQLVGSASEARFASRFCGAYFVAGGVAGAGR